MAGADRRRFREIEQINLVLGDQPSAFRDGNALVIVIAPDLGYAGRPSSAFVAEILLGVAS